MEQHYIVSARKYRPVNFRSVVGQQALTTTLKNAIQTSHLAHAYLFCGPRGVGKTTCARIFAKTINCSNVTPEGEACDQCISCKGFNEQRSFNIHELDAASNNSVDDIRSLVDQVRIPPQIGRYSVYIIDEVHMLSSAAFNAFLKTLEEPPAHAIFILATTEKHKIIPTILSRCQIYDFNRIRISDMMDYLQYISDSEHITVEPEALNIISQKADGAMRDALSIFDQVVSFCGEKVTYQAVIDNLNVLDYDYYFRLVDASLSNNVTEALLIFDEIINKGFEAQHFITGLAAHFRDLLVSRDDITLPLLEVSSSTVEQYRTQAQRCAVESIYRALEITNNCDLNYRQSRNKRLMVELTLIQLCQLNKPTNTTENFTDIKPINSTVNSPNNNIQPQAVKISNPPESSQPATPITHKPSPENNKKATPLTAAPVVRQLESISITANSAKVKEPKSTESSSEHISETINEHLSEKYSEQQLLEAWKMYADTVPEQVHLYNAMCNFPPQMDGDICLVKLVNQQQVRTLTENKTAIERMLAKQLKNTKITLKIEIDDTLSSQLAFTPEDKFKQMVQKNRHLGTLKEQFGLDLEL